MWKHLLEMYPRSTLQFRVEKSEESRVGWGRERGADRQDCSTARSSDSLGLGLLKERLVQVDTLFIPKL